MQYETSSTDSLQNDCFINNMFICCSLFNVFPYFYYKRLFLIQPTYSTNKNSNCWFYKVSIFSKLDSISMLQIRLVLIQLFFIVVKNIETMIKICEAKDLVGFCEKDLKFFAY